MNAIVYVNTPLEAPEHAALAALARREGRAKGQQLRLLAIQAMRRNPMPAGSDSYAAHVAARKQATAKANANLSHAGDDADAGDARPSLQEKKGAHDGAKRARGSAAASAHLATAGDALPAATEEPRAAEARTRVNARASTSRGMKRKGGRA
ncbi:hypothetical protein [Roseimicrobium sp. ORNL1]|uniref:hypothetical protein n=1 Tax=Roseimicrobium sp. ORNL1 TaxID=2711231 RepID=UPI0013E1D194|nr:hypothetical protein [Roseimicrobium sp. ORNL1]QIF02004.1 hypothetical protein G5S37_10825 [Roseimicrobium sp. ORNL1]